MPFRKFFISILLLLALPSGLLHAGEKPEAMLQTLSEEVLDTLQNEREAIRAEPSKLFSLTEQVLGPRVDMDLMAKMVLGKYRRTASDDQMQRFTHEFRMLLVRFYVSALLDDQNTIDEILESRDGLIVFQPTRMEADAKRVTTHANVHLPSGRDVPVVFQLHRYHGPWLIFDVTVENISLVKLYRDNFANEIRTKGLDTLIEDLAKRNAELLNQTAEGEPEASLASHRSA